MRKKKNDVSPVDVQEAQPSAARPRKAKKAVQDSLQQPSAVADDEQARVKAEYENTCKALSEVTVKHERLLKEIKTLRMLLASFNALTLDDDIKPVLPAEDTPYWYIRVMPVARMFEVVPCSWKNWKSDFFRYVQGNMYLDLYTANIACAALNRMLAILSHNDLKI